MMYRTGGHIQLSMCDLCPEHRKLIGDLSRRIEELERRLGAYENANTPPSRRCFPARPAGDPKKPGRKEGHEGATRERPRPDEVKEVGLERCAGCGSRLTRRNVVGTETRIVEDIPNPQPVRVTEYHIHRYRCGRCGKECKAPCREIPEEGRFGNNALAQASVMKHSERLPLRKIKESLESRFGLKVSAASIFDFTRRVSGKMAKMYGEMAGRIRQSHVVNVDETSIRVGGKMYWIWVFVAGNDTLVAVRRSRGGAVLEEVLGKGYSGVVVSDGWKPYASFAQMQQRCWAHLLREADFLERNAAGSAEASALAKGLHGLYDELKARLETDPLPDERERLKECSMRKMEGLLDGDFADGQVARLAGKIRKAGDRWFTFVTDPEVPPTNNTAERGLRECVVQRKIIGTLRNEKGVGIFETAMSMMATWRANGVNPYEGVLECLQS